jgi:hypothetical protein
LQAYTDRRAVSIVRRAASGRRCNQSGHCVEIVGLFGSTRASIPKLANEAAAQRCEFRDRDIGCPEK